MLHGESDHVQQRGASELRNRRENAGQYDASQKLKGLDDPHSQQQNQCQHCARRQTWLAKSLEASISVEKNMGRRRPNSSKISRKTEQ